MNAAATRQALDFASIAFVVFVLVPSGAHLLEMPNKLALAPDDYMVVQRSYDGWWYVGLVIPPALFLLAAQVVLRWRDRVAIGAALASFGCLVAAHAIFWMFTFPANQATLNLTAKPSDFERVRGQWEWSHGAGALLNLAAFAALLWAVVLEPADLRQRKSPADRSAGLFESSRPLGAR